MPFVFTGTLVLLEPEKLSEDNLRRLRGQEARAWMAVQ
jgi:hypothetical protein